MSVVRRTPPPAEPWCLMAQVAYGSLRTIRVPESRIVFCRNYHWTVIARDSDVPLDPLPPGHLYHTPVTVQYRTPQPEDND